MTDKLNIAIAQINPTVGDVHGNEERILRARAEATAAGADLLIFSELVLSGWPPEDLALDSSFQEACRDASGRIAALSADNGPALLIGTPWRDGERLHNAVVLIDRGEVAAVRYKANLPSHGVVDETRLFHPGPMPGPVNFRDIRIGTAIGDDIGTPAVVECLEETGAEIVIIPDASPFEANLLDRRMNQAVARVTESDRPIIYVNQVGGQDDLVFDGGSFVVGADRRLRAQLPTWRESIALTRWFRGTDRWECSEGQITENGEGLEAIYSALVVGLRDYVEKNGFAGVLIGLSGGIDSALTAVIAADALGRERVRCVMMPSPYTSRRSFEDAGELAAALGTEYRRISIEPAMQAFHAMLANDLDARPEGVTEENIQARARGLTLMALSNLSGWLVVSTGNKSETAVGYATIYGDMCGGYAVLKDVYKTTVFALSRWRNGNQREWFRGPTEGIIPESILSKAPSAELRPNQTDQDSLPPYDVLDDILGGIIESGQSVAEIAARGHSPEVIHRIRHMVDAAEHKRRQAPPGVRLSQWAFDRDRRYPVTNRFRGLG